MSKKDIRNLSIGFFAVVALVFGFYVRDNQVFALSAQSSELGFSSASPSGSEGGMSLPASCESGYQHDASDCTITVSANPNPIVATNQSTNPFALLLSSPLLQKLGIAPLFAGAGQTTLSWRFNQVGPSSGFSVASWSNFESPYSCTVTGPGGRTFLMGGSVSGSMQTPAIASDASYTVSCKSVPDINTPSVGYDYTSGTYVVRFTGIPVDIPPLQCACNSAPNSCGMTNPGLKTCGSAEVCSVPPPSDDQCAVPKITIGDPWSILVSDYPPAGTAASTTPNVPPDTIPNIQNINANTAPIFDHIVPKGESCVIQWDARPASRCSISGPGFSRNVSVSGVFTTPRIGTDTAGSAIYNLTCFSGTTVAARANFACRLKPSISEIN